MKIIFVFIWIIFSSFCLCVSVLQAGEPASYPPFREKTRSQPTEDLDQLRRKLRDIEQLFLRLKEAVPPTPPEISVPKIPFQEKTVELEEALDEKERLLKERDQSLTELQTEIHTLNQKIRVLQNEFQRKNENLLHLTEQLKTLSLNIVEKDQMIAQREDDISTLHNSFDELEQRLNLVQHLIQEKDNRIQKLEDNIQSLSLVREDYTSSLQVQESDLEELKELIAVQDNRLAHLETWQNQQQALMEDLKKTVIRKEKAIRQYDLAMTRKDQEIKEISGILEIYKWKLAEKNRADKHAVQRGQKWEDHRNLSEKAVPKEPRMDTAVEPQMKLLLLKQGDLKRRMVILQEHFKDTQKEFRSRDQHVLTLVALLTDAQDLIDQLLIVLNEQELKYVRLFKEYKKITFDDNSLTDLAPRVIYPFLRGQKLTLSGEPSLLPLSPLDLGERRSPQEPPFFQDQDVLGDLKNDLTSTDQIIRDAKDHLDWIQRLSQTLEGPSPAVSLQLNQMHQDIDTAYQTWYRSSHLIDALESKRNKQDL